MSTGLIDRSRIELKLGEYGTASSTALSDPSLLPRVQEYRRMSSARMQPLDREEISKRIPSAEYHVSRKVDGEFTTLVYRDGQAFTINPGGTVRVGMPWLEEAKKLLADAQVKEALIPGELFVDQPAGRRERVHDVTSVARQPQSTGDLESLRFAVFDIVSLNGSAEARPYPETWKSIEKIFGQGEKVRPVEAKSAKDAAAIQKLFEEWVEKQGSEGLVVRSESAGMFKIKPRHTLDVAVIGFTESVGDRQGMLHDLLMAVMRHDGTLQVLSRVGGGFSEDERREMLSDLKDMVVESEYAEVNSDHVAYQMVDPQWVIEISCLDLISQTTRGGSINRMVLDYQKNGRDLYHVVTKLPLATVISPQFVRRRDDKALNRQDVRIEQITDIVEVPLVEKDARQLTLPASEILRREVYTKDLKGQTMVRKFLMWQTHKEGASEEFPAYVAHYTDFSPNRKDPLAREIRVSSSREQIQSLYERLKEENIKAGWNAVAAKESSAPQITAVAATPAAASAEPVEAAPQKASKKAARKKASLSTGPAAEVQSPQVDDSKMAPSERGKRTPRKKKSG